MERKEIGEGDALPVADGDDEGTKKGTNVSRHSRDDESQLK